MFQNANYMRYEVLMTPWCKDVVSSPLEAETIIANTGYEHHFDTADHQLQ